MKTSESRCYGDDAIITHVPRSAGSFGTDLANALGDPDRMSPHEAGSVDGLPPCKPPPRRTVTLGVNVHAADDLAHVVSVVRASLAQRRRLLVTFVNPSTRDVMRRRPNYRRQLELIDLVLPDGVGMSVAVRWLHGIAAARVSFDMTSLAVPVLQIAEEEGYRVALVGGVPGRGEQALSRIHEKFPGLCVVGCFDGYGEIAARARQIVAAGPDIVICGMGAGAQEEMLLKLAQAGWRGCGFTCGGFLDQVAERLDYYPRWVDRLQLRWAYRLASEPRRLWRRYLIAYPEFVAALGWHVLLALFRAPSDAFDDASAEVVGRGGLVLGPPDDTAIAERP